VTADESDPETVVLHDGSINPGGAVDVALEAARALEADLVVGFSGMPESWWRERAPRGVAVLTRREEKSTLRDARLAWKLLNLSLDGYDRVLTSGPSAKFYQTYGDQTRVHYMHHPPLSALWFEGGLFGYALKTVDRVETWSVERVVTNSELTARRLRTQYAREAHAVVHPPVDVNRFRHDRARDPGTVAMVGRLEDRKRVDLAVAAFDRIGDVDGVTPELHLLGDGPHYGDLKRRAPPNVHVHGYVEEGALIEWLETASAGLFLARREDFGIAPVEYMAAGLPVVGVDEPNTNNQVRAGESGLLVEPTVGAVRRGVETALGLQWDRERVRRAAEAYGVDRFRERIRAVFDADTVTADGDEVPDDE
jgi:glycosyltransferase involved in cell wall biosynthesis